MASLVRQYDKKKLLGQIYTPEHVVEKILDDAGYLGINILEKHVLDPSCGDGQFLLKIVSRILQVSSSRDLKKNLSYVHGWDIDPLAISQCKANLDTLVEEYEISIDWNLTICDSLNKAIELENKIDTSEHLCFDFIVGNPPYVRIQHLDEKTRKLIQRDYRFCKKGSTDIYIAFFELSLRLLKEEGVCGLITPNSFMFTDTADAFRTYVSTNRLLRKIVNYGSIQVFDEVTTYCAITIFSRLSNPTFIYEQAFTLHDTIKKEIFANRIPQKGPWQLSASKEMDLRGIKLKDICKIHVGLTTLCDKAYFFNADRVDDTYFLADTKLGGRTLIEAAILKPLIKVSKLKNSNQMITEYALFPYEQINGIYTIIPEERIKRQYPLAYRYLTEIRSTLDMRDNGKLNKVAWYAYGRNQGINLPKGKKIVFSPMNKYPNFIEINVEDALFYSGYCLLTSHETVSILEQLNSDRMYDFISISSRDFRGGWKGYNKKVVQEFTIQR